MNTLRALTARRSLSLLVLAIAAGAASVARADDCQLTILANDRIQYDARTLHVDAGCSQVEITLRHVGKQDAHVLGHGWVLAQTADVAALASAGMAAGFDSGYLPAGDKRVIAATKIVGGGQATTITIGMSRLVVGGDYTFFCSYPGHSAMMRGRFQVTASASVASNRAEAATQPAPIP